MIDIQKIAREAGIHIYPEYTAAFTRFAALIREAVVQELVAVSVKPEAVTMPHSIPYYTADQLAGAVLRERGRCAEVCEQIGKYDDSVDDYYSDIYAAAIRSGE